MCFGFKKEKTLIKRAVLLVTLLVLNASALDCNKPKNQLLPKCAHQDNKEDNRIELLLDETHKNLIDELASMHDFDKYKPQEIKRMLEQSQKEWVKFTNQECMALNMLVSPNITYKESPIYHTCYENYAQQRIQTLNDFYQESKRTKKAMLQEEKSQQNSKNEKISKKSSSKNKHDEKKLELQPNKKESKQEQQEIKISSQKSAPPKPTQALLPQTPPPNNQMKQVSLDSASKYYLQVGAFMNTPNKAFLQTLKTFSYKLEKRDVLTHYLIGPYKSKEEALEHINYIAKKFENAPIVVESH